ncbi:HNH endonuclease [Brasilonema octagenarum UFV-OR1]|uniref:HNH endonuclease n=1 Tax=Brasilonema octagenarum UFV-OR1 TaxID=417115 RepID=A0ABX1M9W9_9CYAN|nr:HNH endonuclease [Brasilonema octagenarum UFV-OR1]
MPASVRVSVLHKDGYKCVFCGRSSQQVQLEVDHIVPFSKGGSNDLNNLQTLCTDCNRGKGARFLKK